jgi:hypothetical protein
MSDDGCTSGCVFSIVREADRRLLLSLGSIGCCMICVFSHIYGAKFQIAGKHDGKVTIVTQ